MINSEKNEIFNNRPEPESGVLYLVGTPIGNLADISPRAKSLLNKVSFIACEDTRHSNYLLKSLGIKASLISFHKHNAKSKLGKILKLLSENESIALITDAGLPGISDPGEELVAATKKANHKVICIPGPCAATTALVSSGLPSNKFCFEGFLPYKTKEREKALNEIAQEKRTTIIYESPKKLLKLLEDLAKVCGEDRPLEVSRELTKQYEEQIGKTIREVLAHFKEIKPRGEFTIVLGGFYPNEIKEENTSKLIFMMNNLTKEGATASQAAKEISKQTGQSRRLLYSLLHQNKSENGNNEGNA